MSNNKYKILIIEDESNIRSFIKTILEANGYQVLDSKNGTQGKLMFSSYYPDLIILDLGLPDFDRIYKGNSKSAYGANHCLVCENAGKR